MHRVQSTFSKLLFSLTVLLMMLFMPLTAYAAGNNTTNSTTNATASIPGGNSSDVLRIGWTTKPDSISPFITYEAVSTELFLLMYDPLVAIGNNNKPQPRLAKSWTVSKDHLTWTFHLRKDVKWQDGQPFTSADVKWTYDTMMKTKLGLYASFENGIKSVTAPDKYTVVIKTKSPKANMLQITTPILPKHIWDKVNVKQLKKWPNSQPIGTGAFQLVKWVKGQYIELKANPNYFMGAPKVKDIVFQLFANSSTMAQALQTGEINAAIGINGDYYQKLKQQKNISVVKAPSRGFTELAFNSWNSPKSHGNPLMKNLSIRHAIAYAINRQDIINVAYSGMGKPGSTLVPANYTFWHWQPPASQLRTYNVSKANQILDAAGFTKRTANGTRENSKGQKLDFNLLVRSASSEDVKAGNMIKDMLQKVGITLNVQSVDDGTLNNKIYKKDANFDMFIWGWGTDLDPTTILRVLSTKEIGNLSDSYFSNKQYDSLLAKEQTTIDPAARQKIVYQMQQIAYQQEPYLIFMYGDSVQAVRTDKFTGWKPIQGSYFMGFNNWNYLHVEPVSAKKAAGTKAAGGSNSKAYIWVIALVVLVLVGAGFYVRSRRKSDFDRE